MKTIGVVSVARSDFGIYRPLLRRIQSDADLQLRLYVAGSHLAPEFGLTVREIESEGFSIFRRIETLLASDSPEGIAKSMALGTAGFAQAFSADRPDLLVVLGDRFDMYPAALAALPYKLPVAHIHGGELTAGAIDDALRHSMTKLSHLHFVSTEEYARRVRQLGEEPWRITVSGALGLDNLRDIKLLSRDEVEQRWKLRLGIPFLLATYHPVTLEYEQAETQTREFLRALEAIQMPAVVTLPNADTNGRIIIQLLREFAAAHPRIQIVDSLGTQGYFSLMGLAAAMVGNSSSGILEAASFKLPVVNIGTRQLGRCRSRNVIDCGYGHEEIGRALRKALDGEFRRGLLDLANPYRMNRPAADIIVDRIHTTPLDARLTRKAFVDSHEGAFTAQ